jgi:hypothetical protein
MTFYDNPCLLSIDNLTEESLSKHHVRAPNPIIV